jgi:hypothetical protein
VSRRRGSVNFLSVPSSFRGGGYFVCSFNAMNAMGQNGARIGGLLVITPRTEMDELDADQRSGTERS